MSDPYLSPRKAHSYSRKVILDAIINAEQHINNLPRLQSVNGDQVSTDSSDIVVKLPKTPQQEESPVECRVPVRDIEMHQGPIQNGEVSVSTLSFYSSTQEVEEESVLSTPTTERSMELSLGGPYATADSRESPKKANEMVEKRNQSGEKIVEPSRSKPSFNFQTIVPPSRDTSNDWSNLSTVSDVSRGSLPFPPQQHPKESKPKKVPPPDSTDTSNGMSVSVTVRNASGRAFYPEGLDKPKDAEDVIKPRSPVGTGPIQDSDPTLTDGSISFYDTSLATSAPAENNSKSTSKYSTSDTENTTVMCSTCSTTPTLMSSTYEASGTTQSGTGSDWESDGSSMGSSATSYGGRETSKSGRGRSKGSRGTSKSGRCSSKLPHGSSKRQPGPSKIPHGSPYLFKKSLSSRGTVKSSDTTSHGPYSIPQTSPLSQCGSLGIIESDMGLNEYLASNGMLCGTMGPLVTNFGQNESCGGYSSSTVDTVSKADTNTSTNSVVGYTDHVILIEGQHYLVRKITFEKSGRVVDRKMLKELTDLERYLRRNYCQCESTQEETKLEDQVRYSRKLRPLTPQAHTPDAMRRERENVRSEEQRIKKAVSPTLDLPCQHENPTSQSEDRSESQKPRKLKKRRSKPKLRSHSEPKSKQKTAESPLKENTAQDFSPRETCISFAEVNATSPQLYTPPSTVNSSLDVEVASKTPEKKMDKALKVKKKTEKLEQAVQAVKVSKPGRGTRTRSRPNDNSLQPRKRHPHRRRRKKKHALRQATSTKKTAGNCDNCILTCACAEDSAGSAKGSKKK